MNQDDNNPVVINLNPDITVTANLPEVVIPPESEFTEGVPIQLTCSVSMKITTRPYENIDLFTSVTSRLRYGANVTKAYDELFDYQVKNILTPKYHSLKQKFAPKDGTNSNS